MIRPIDTQILYPQTPELGNRQHTDNQKANVHQEQFAQLMHKEAEHKKEVVDSAKEGQKMDNNVNKDHKQSNGGYKEQRKKQANPKNNKASKDPYCTSQFDIRI